MLLSNDRFNHQANEHIVVVNLEHESRDSVILHQQLFYTMNSTILNVRKSTTSGFHPLVHFIFSQSTHLYFILENVNFKLTRIHIKLSEF